MIERSSMPRRTYAMLRLVALMCCVLSCLQLVEGFAGAGVVAIYYHTEWTPIVTVTYTYQKKIGPELFETKVETVPMWEFWGPLPKYHSTAWKYVELPTSSATKLEFNATNRIDFHKHHENPEHYHINDTWLDPQINSAGIYTLHAYSNKVDTLQKFEGVCPGNPPWEPNTHCNSHGVCLGYSQECDCDPGWVNPGCDGYGECSQQKGMVAEGAVAQVLKGVQTPAECCTACAQNSPVYTCVAANYNAEDFTCAILSNITSMKNELKHAPFKSVIGLPTSQSPVPPTLAPGAAPTGSPPPAPSPPHHPHFTSRPLFYILVGVIPVVVLILGVVVIRTLTRSSRRTQGGLAKETTPLMGNSPGSATQADASVLYGGKYKILKVLGRGSFGVVYLVARQSRGSGPLSMSNRSMSNEVLAMKVIHCHSDDEMMAAFGEFRSLNELQGHSGIVALVDMFMSWEAPGGARSVENGTTSVNHVRSLSAQRPSEDALSPNDPKSSSKQLRLTTPPSSDLFTRESTSTSPNSSRLDAPRSTVAGAPPINIVSRSMQSMRSPPSNNDASTVGADDLTPLHSGLFENEEDFENGSNRHATRYLCLIMEHYEEGNLEAAISDDPKFFKQREVILSYSQQLFAALAHSHSKNIIHRDLKPGNVLLTDGRERVAITDFGLAKDLSGTSTSAAGGTLHYLAPEQLDHRCSKKSDVWSAACVILAMITGTVGGNVRAVFMLRHQQDFEDTILSEVCSIVPDWFADLLIKMLSASPIDRPSFEECLAAMDGHDVDDDDAVGTATTSAAGDIREHHQLN